KRVEQRIIYKNAKILLATGKTAQYQALKAKLTDYPLLPFLLAEELRKGKSTDQDLKNFMEKYSDTSVFGMIQSQWFSRLAGRGNWSAYAEEYDRVLPTGNDYLCWRARAAYELGESAAIQQDWISKLWLVSNSQPNSCNAIFDRWQAKGLINDEMYVQRIIVALEKNNVTMAKFLTKSIRNISLRNDVLKGIEWHTRPTLLKQVAPLIVYSNSTTRRMALNALNRWIRVDKVESLATLRNYINSGRFTAAEMDKQVPFFGRYLSFSYHPDAYYWLTHSDLGTADTILLERRMMVALDRRNWIGAYVWGKTLENFGRTQEDSWKIAKGEYWQARALLKISQHYGKDLIEQRLTSNTSHFPDVKNLGVHVKLHRSSMPFQTVCLAFCEKSNPQQFSEQGVELLDVVSKDRHYYGFLASEILNKPLALNDQKLKWSNSAMQKFLTESSMSRIDEFNMLGDKDRAQREWFFTIRGLKPEERWAAARLAHSWGWHFHAIMTAAKFDAMNDLAVRFPMAFQDIVYRHSQRRQLSTDWVFSVIRQESAFRPAVKSQVGATGMMQLMPATARHVSRKNQLQMPTPARLADPDFNITLGTAYLRELLDEFDNNIVMATAAYNAGPHRVREWRPIFSAEPGDIWIEKIPFDETRNYVQNILAFQAIYKQHMGQIVRMAQDMNEISPKNSGRSAKNTSQFANRE
ncbi:MAG: transglycosylase SLT domain-containing protein, partial [Pseudomonadota bacterium]